MSFLLASSARWVARSGPVQTLYRAGKDRYFTGTELGIEYHFRRDFYQVFQYSLLFSCSPVINSIKNINLSMFKKKDGMKSCSNLSPNHEICHRYVTGILPVSTGISPVQNLSIPVDISPIFTDFMPVFCRYRNFLCRPVYRPVRSGPNIVPGR